MLNYFAGLMFSLLLGHIANKYISLYLTDHILEKCEEANLKIPDGDHPHEKISKVGIAPEITGFIERFFFTLAIPFKVRGVLLAMVAWITIRTWISWGHKINTQWGRAFALQSLLLGMVSMLFALIGGMLILRGFTF